MFSQVSQHENVTDHWYLVANEAENENFIGDIIKGLDIQVLSLGGWF